MSTDHAITYRRRRGETILFHAYHAGTKPEARKEARAVLEGLHRDGFPDGAVFVNGTRIRPAAVAQDMGNE